VTPITWTQGCHAHMHDHGVSECVWLRVGVRERERDRDALSYDWPREFQTSQRLGPSMSIT